MWWWYRTHLQEGLPWTFSDIEILILDRWSNWCLGWWSKGLALGVRHQLDEVNIFVPLLENLPSRLLYWTQYLGLGIKRQPSLPHCVCTSSLNNYFLLIVFNCINKCKSFGLTISLYSYFGAYKLLLYVKYSLHIITYKDNLSQLV